MAIPKNSTRFLTLFLKFHGIAGIDFRLSLKSCFSHTRADTTRAPHG